ncbi:cupin domain-containing protein [Aestuariibacter sp. AA17]|uniref:Cupin domain-containing protein n=1 Tax=Fluctibacter corallii TaxID=2984329 RepID=A0ABT3A458_9ALTE|nr:cupin domain-containing protein [Aestuariibacter sp. AA17]MCV2883473.1 cupin domain-containing protein [Aestuariibacter sp. AA17]
MFKPNRLTFDQGLERIKKAYEKRGYSYPTKIVSSQDKAMKQLTADLEVDNVPEGFKKVQFPVFMEKPSQLFYSVGAPDTKVKRHSHDEGDGFRLIVGGSIIYKDQELKEGDWMFIPAGEPYEFDVGPSGAMICYCYCCCCA